MALVRERYADFGPTLAREKLEEYHDIRVVTETLRPWMIAAGIWKTRAQRRKRIQQPRHRRDCYGELIQIERAHQTLQDRLVKELRLRGISTMDDANAYLPVFVRHLFCW